MEIFVRKINLNLYEREFPPLSSSVAPSRRGLINEIAFRLFVETQRAPFLTEGVEGKATSEAQKLIRSLDRSLPVDTSPPTSEEMLDAKEQLSRLAIFFQKEAKEAKLELSPSFAGCGIVDACNGDVYFDQTLFEIKAGDRNFRSIDVRQILTYAALNYATAKRKIDRLGLFNPRLGISFIAGIDELCLEVSGYPASQTLSEIVRVISSGDISR